MAPDREEILDTRAPNIKGLPLSVMRVDLLPGRGDKRLHAVVACSKDARAEHVDNQMQSSIPSFCQTATPSIYHCSGRIATIFRVSIGQSSRNGDKDQVHEEYKGPSSGAEVHTIDPSCLPRVIYRVNDLRCRCWCCFCIAPAWF